MVVMVTQRMWAGGISAEATVTMTSPDTIDIQGCRGGIFCQTLTYTRA